LFRRTSILLLHLILIILHGFVAQFIMLTTSSLFQYALIVCVLFATKTASLLHSPFFFACRPVDVSRSPTPHHAPALPARRGWALGPHRSVPTSSVVTVDVPDPANGTAVEVLYDEADEIGTVIDRGLAAHGVGTREVLVSVRLDGEILSPEHYGNAVGGRRLEMVFKKDSVAHVAIAFAGVLLSKVGSLEAEIVELKADNVVLKAENVVLKANDAKQEDAIRNQNDAIRNQNDTIRNQNDAIRNQNDTIRKQNDAIRNQNDTIRKQNDTICKLEANDAKQEDAIRNLVADIRNQNDAIRNQNDTIRNLVAENVLKRVMMRASIVDNVVKDFGDLFRLRSTNTTLATSLKAMSDKRNDAVHFMRAGQTSLQNFSALRTYLSREKLDETRQSDSCAVLSAKVWMLSEFLKQGLPEVRVPTFPPHPRPHHTTPHHTTRTRTPPAPVDRTHPNVQDIREYYDLKREIAGKVFDEMANLVRAVRSCAV